MGVIEDINTAIDSTKKGEFSKAEKIYKNILKTDDKNVLALSCLGLLYLDLRDYKKAENLLLKAYNLKPSQSILEGLALAKFYMSDFKQADKYFRQIIDTTKNYQVQEKNIETLIKLTDYKTAYKYAKTFYEKYPLNKESIVNYAKSCIYTGQFQTADNLLKTAVKRFSKYGDVWATLGLLYEIYYRDNERARDCFLEELKYGDKFDAYYNLTVTSEKLGDMEKTKFYVNKLAKYTGEKDHTVAFIKASLCFKQRKFKQGLRHFLYRGWKNRKPTHKLKNIWDGNKYKDQTLFVLGDNGIGDIIMYSRYLPFLSDKFKKIKVYIRTDVRNLIKRFCQNYPNIIFVEKTKRFPHYDMSVHLSDLPYYLKMPFDNIPSSKGYLTSDKTKVEEYKKYFKNNKLKTGICWEAGTIGIRDLIYRTLNVSLFETLFHLPNVQFYSLQVNPSMDNYKNYDCLTDLGKTFKTCDDTLGAIENLDLVITVDTSVAHLAGALGKKTFLLLPYCSDWRWFDNDKKTKWYDSVKIYKQTNPKSWDDVFERIYKDLTV